MSSGANFRILALGIAYSRDNPSLKGPNTYSSPSTLLLVLNSISFTSIIVNICIPDDFMHAYAIIIGNTIKLLAADVQSQTLFLHHLADEVTNILGFLNPLKL